eukprot:CAMPEP_0115171024 /NCGR_PEP_ID=MMETSP0270-20121206/2093_1 /TAXON_ID=71861 /ORGANISM="Scrippsiella trochoidea, Strain CCMP3099" /LENGTH=58 /DNA_ID=CAMNT_0002583785 /DNA_START=116 /DNA_END=292 /DNA_ORIENTATION=+
MLCLSAVMLRGKVPVPASQLATCTNGCRRGSGPATKCACIGSRSITHPVAAATNLHDK